MDIIKELIHALWQQDFETLANPSLVWTLYILLFMILFLVERPAAGRFPAG